MLGSCQCRGVLLIWMKVGQGPTAIVADAGWDCFAVFFFSTIILLSFSLSLGSLGDGLT